MSHMDGERQTKRKVFTVSSDGEQLSKHLHMQCQESVSGIYFKAVSWEIEMLWFLLLVDRWPLRLRAQLSLGHDTLLVQRPKAAAAVMRKYLHWSVITFFSQLTLTELTLAATAESPGESFKFHFC